MHQFRCVKNIREHFHFGALSKPPTGGKITAQFFPELSRLPVFLWGYRLKFSSLLAANFGTEMHTKISEGLIFGLLPSRYTFPCFRTLKDTTF